MGKLSFSREPVIWVAAIKAIIYVLLLIFTQLTVDRVLAIVAVVEPLSALIVRQKVYAPVSKDGDKLEAVKYANQPLESVGKPLA